MSAPLYKRAACVVLPAGRGWPVDNSRPGRGAATDFGANSVGYVHQRGQGRSQIFVVGEQRLFYVNNDEFQPFNPLSVGPRSDPKLCLSCARLKPLSEFPLNQNNLRGPITRPRCQQCYTAESGKPLSPKTIREFRQRVNAPERGDLWRCPICRKISIAEVTAKLVVDHDQERRKPRGIICDSCNTGLGRFKNGEDHIQSAVEYLNEYEARQGHPGA